MTNLTMRSCNRGRYHSQLRSLSRTPVLHISSTQISGMSKTRRSATRLVGDKREAAPKTWLLFATASFASLAVNNAVVNYCRLFSSAEVRICVSFAGEVLSCRVFAATARSSAVVGNQQREQHDGQSPRPIASHRNPNDDELYSLFPVSADVEYSPGYVFYLTVCKDLFQSFD